MRIVCSTMKVLNQSVADSRLDSSVGFTLSYRICLILSSRLYRFSVASEMISRVSYFITQALYYNKRELEGIKWRGKKPLPKMNYIQQHTN